MAITNVPTPLKKLTLSDPTNTKYNKRYRIWYGDWLNDETRFPVYVRVYGSWGSFVSKRYGKVLGRTPHHACPPSERDDRLREEYVYVIGLIPDKPWLGIDFPAKWLRMTNQEEYEKQVRKDYGSRDADG